MLHTGELPASPMNRIHLLPEALANQIAAGEVIERPASVVKELVENALDAQSTRIVVETQNGGRSLIRVSDDGWGMSRDDALLCLERHATSKIRHADDLQAITSLGFRGEALPSIASVSQFTLLTRERDSNSPEGSQITVHGGRIQSVRAAGAPTGTVVEVRQLFYNLPARRKFLRSEETERAHIQHYLTLAMLAFPEVGFTLIQDQRTVWKWPPVFPDDAGANSAQDQLRERLRQLHGADLPWVAVQHTTHTSGDENDRADASTDAVTIRGWIGAPGISRATREDQHLFVNRRPVENRALNFALLEGYHTALMKGRYPVACLFIELHPSMVDVNVHPAKKEVRFRHDRSIRLSVIEAVRKALLGYHRPGATSLHGSAPVASPTNHPKELDSPEASAHTQSDLIGWEPAQPLAPASIPANQPPPATSLQPPMPRPALSSTLAATSSAPGSKFQGVNRSHPSAPAAPHALPAAQPLLSVPLRIVGVVGQLYVVMESDRGLVLLDQHAAHERVLFEQVLQRLQSDAAPSQRLLLPETVELAARDAAFLREQLGVLARLGVQLSEFGERTFLLDGLPPFVKTPDARAFVVGLVDALKAAGQQVNTLRLAEETIAKTVCRHAVKARDPLQGPELQELLASLRQCAMPYTCPHGRPTLIEFNYQELERRFGRTN